MLSSSSDESLFLHDDITGSLTRQAEAKAVAEEERWKCDFRTRLAGAVPRFTSQRIINRTRLHCVDFQKTVTENEEYAAEVRKLTVTAIQLLAVSSPASALQRDIPYFKAEYVNTFVEREEIRGRTNDEVDRKLASPRGSGRELCKIYDEIKRTAYGQLRPTPTSGAVQEQPLTLDRVESQLSAAFPGRQAALPDDLDFNPSEGVVGARKRRRSGSPSGDISAAIQPLHQPSLRQALTSQPHTTKTGALRADPSAVNTTGQKAIHRAFYQPWVDVIEEVFADIEPILEMARSAQKHEPECGRWVSPGLRLQVYANGESEMMIELGKADGEHCSKAASKVMEMFKEFHGVSVQLQHQIKVTMPGQHICEQGDCEAADCLATKLAKMFFL
jgi:hypothetical protein